MILKFLETDPMLVCCVLLWWLAGLVGGCPTNPPPSPTAVGVGQFWVPGFSLIVGGWVS